MGARLQMELTRLLPLNPFETLRLSSDATPEQIRAAFLAATKQYHPNRFARESAATVEAANEIFLLIRRAYGQLTDESKRQAWRMKLGRGSGPLPRSKRGLEAAPPPVASLTPALGMPIVSAPAPRSIPPTQPPVGPPPTQPPVGPPPTARAPGTQPPAGPPPQAAASSRAPGTQPPRGPAPSAAAAPLVRPRPPTIQGPPAPVKVASPQTGRSSAEVRALLESAKTRSQRFDLAVRHVQKKRFREAKGILTQLVAEDPSSRRFRVKLYHAAALELQEEGKLDEAIRELERAVALDHEAHDVQDALRKALEQRGRGGIFSKIFGR